MGLFAGSGVGKSVLLGMMARYTEADVIVVGLIGERGREVKEFIEQILGEEGMRRAVVVAAPADTGPLMRLQGAAYATAIAEHFRDEGKQAGLVISALTQREQLTEIVELPTATHPWFMGVQFHPEFKSTPWGGHPLFSSYVRAALDHQRQRLDGTEAVGAVLGAL